MLAHDLPDLLNRSDEKAPASAISSVSPNCLQGSTSGGTVFGSKEKTMPADTQIETDEEIRWSLPTRIAFRFCFCYLLLTGLSCIFIFAEDFPGGEFWNPWRAPLPWICSHIFNIQRKIYIDPESDYLSGYLQHLLELVLALGVTLVWSLLDLRRSSYRKLCAWFTLFLRFALAITLFSYGFDKVYPLQFHEVTPSRLMLPVGQLSREGLLWMFMASSAPYTIFCGVLEVLAGVFLLVPRMEMMGALLSVAVLGNVVALNLCYGVPVKLFSLHLLLISVFLASPAMLRIVNMLVLRRTVSPTDSPQLSHRRWVDRGARIGIVVLGAVLGVLDSAHLQRRYSELQAASVTAKALPFYGAWVVDTFSVLKDGPQSLFTRKLESEYRVGPGEDHWLGLSINSPKVMVIQLRSGVFDSVDFALDARTNEAQVSDSADPAWKAKLMLQQSGKDLLNLQGTVNGVPISATLHRVEISELPLVKGKFRFIRPDPN
jgi:hypothetical protein